MKYIIESFYGHYNVIISKVGSTIILSRIKNLFIGFALTSKLILKNGTRILYSENKGVFKEWNEPKAFYYTITSLKRHFLIDLNT
jgi:hypothetical protein